MAVFPLIQSPCPYKSRLGSIMDGDMCRMCKRQVFDLTAWSDDERVAFLAGCADQVCVSYRLPLRPAIAAAALAAAAMPMAAAAQDASGAPPAAESTPPEIEYIFVGGIKDPANARFVETAEDGNLPELPVVYEDQAPASPARR